MSHDKYWALFYDLKREYYFGGITKPNNTRIVIHYSNNKPIKLHNLYNKKYSEDIDLKEYIKLVNKYFLSLEHISQKKYYEL